MYISDLICRFHSRDIGPQLGPFPSSADSVSWQAHREAEKINTLEYYDECAEIVNNNNDNESISDVAFIVSNIIKNTASGKFIDLYLRIPYRQCDASALMHLIDGAIRGKIVDYHETVMQMMEMRFKVDLHVSSAIEYLGEIIGASAIDLIGKYLDNDRWGRCSPFCCSIELGNIGDKSAVPFLTRAIDRNRKGRKGWQRDVVKYSERALVKISGNS